KRLMPPPAPAELFESVELVIVRMLLGSLLIPPPLLAELAEMAQLAIVRVPLLKIPPPLLPGTFPPAMVKPEIVTLVLAPTSKTRKLGIIPKKLRCMVSRFAPGPVIVRFLSITNSLLVRLTVVRPAAKLIVSPGDAVAIA